MSMAAWDIPLVSVTNTTGMNMPLDLDGMTWPQLHETYFLQDDPFVGLFETTVSLAHQSNATQDTTLNVLAPDDPMAALSDEADDLVHCATTAASGDAVGGVWEARLHTADVRLRILLQSTLAHAAANDLTLFTLGATTELYIQHFNCLWPMFGKHDLKASELHPILYLVVVSIGSMYGSNVHKHFGTLLHKRLRRLLTASLFDLEGHDSDSLWLAHARLLTQVQGLYFGQKKAFSYAQVSTRSPSSLFSHHLANISKHLGAILIAQSRRLNLFEGYSIGHDESLSNRLDTATDYGRWRQAELLRRLAFGILRADVYTSVLLNTRPLMSFEEVNLTLPGSENLWQNADNLSPREQAIAARAEAQHSSQMAFSDLLRILVDRKEPAVHVGIIGTELCLFGLQPQVWRFAHDLQQFQRLTGAHWSRQNSDRHTLMNSNDVRHHTEVNDASVSLTHRSTSFASNERPQNMPTLYSLEQARRQMCDMSDDRERVELALDKWYDGFQAALRSSDFADNRTPLSSSLLLWNLSHLQLHAPLQVLHDVSYRLVETQRADARSVRAARAWALTDDAMVAARRALTIFNLIQNELQQPPERHAHFNFIAFAALHHAAVVLWVISEIRREDFLAKDLPDSAYGRMLQAGNTHGLLQACAQLFRDLSPLGGASFSNAAERLSTSPFPLAT